MLQTHLLLNPLLLRLLLPLALPLPLVLPLLLPLDHLLVEGGEGRLIIVVEELLRVLHQLEHHHLPHTVLGQLDQLSNEPLLGGL